MLNEGYIKYVFNAAIISNDANNMLKEYNRGIYGKKEVYNYIYSLCLRKIVKDDNFDKLSNDDYDYLWLLCINNSIN
jgi:hypothetical protein